MNCPACHTALRELPTPEGVTIHFCGTCRGSWFDNGKLLYVVKRPSALAPMLERPLVAAAASPLACPRCSTAMERGGVGSSLQAVIERCTSCGGIWLASGMRTRLDQISAPSGAPAIRAASVVASAPAAAAATPTKAAFAAAPPPASGPPRPASGPPRPLPRLPDLGLRSVMVLGALYGMTFIAMILAVAYVRLGLDVAVVLAMIVITAQYFLSPILLDLFLRWLQSMDWVTREELPPHLVAFMDKVCRARKIPFPRVGVIDDGNPNAFTYGHYPANARLIITSGLIEILEEDELEAVVAHEIGHIAHWDFIVMTLAALVPVLLYWTYRLLGGGEGDRKRVPVQIVVAVYLMYVVSEYLILLLSRAREYYADRFSGAATRQPNALAGALVKIAYGLAAAKPEEAAAKSSSGLRAISALGVFDPRAALNLAAASARASGVAPQDIVGAMQWDLWNPWAGFYELGSTHPLPAKRILALGQLAERLGQEPAIRFDSRQPESYWDEFFFDVMITALPLALPFAALGLMLPAMALMGGLGSLWGLHALGIALVGYGVGALIRTIWSYRAGEFPSSTVATLLQEVKVSGVRSVPVRLKGAIIGRGIPGLIYSEDLVLRDDTGFIFLDYRQPFRLMELWFGLARAGDLIGREVIATGWYRRAPTPFLELRTLEIDGDIRQCWVRTAKILAAAVAIVVGMVLAVA